MNIDNIESADLEALKGKGYTENDLGMLADSEVQALLARPENPADEDVDAHAAAAAAQDAAVAAAIKPPDTPAVPEGGSASTAEANEEAPAPELPAFKAPADAEAKIAAEKEKEAENFKRLMDGEIDADEYQRHKKTHEAAIEALREEVLTAKIGNNMAARNAEQTALNEWRSAETKLMGQFKSEGVDYRGKPALLAAYNHNLKALAADEKNGRKDSAWFLSEAHKLTMADLGIAKNVLPNTSRKVDISEIPPTLRSVPAAASSVIAPDEFANLRQLMDNDPIAFERAVAGLSDAQRDRWMAT